MEEAGFDPGGFYEFDLARGAVRTRSGARVLVLSDDVVGLLVSAAVQKGDLTGLRRLGQGVGEHAKQSLGGSATEQTPETVLGHAASCLGLFGFGRVRLDAWGDVLVASIDGAPALDAGHVAIGALLGGLFTALSGNDVVCVSVGRDGQFVVLDPGIASQVEGWAKQGADVATVVSRLAPGAP